MSVRTWELKTCTGRTIRIVEADGGEKSESTIDVDGELMMKVTFSGARGKWKRRGILEGAASDLGLNRCQSSRSCVVGQGT